MREIDPGIVGELYFSDISFDFTKLVKKYEPYGQRNPTPKFISKNVEILQADTMVKKENTYVSLSHKRV